MTKKSLKKNIDIKVFRDIYSLQQYASDIFLNEINEGLCIISGGNTPKDIYKIISTRNNIKSDRKIILADDRIVNNKSELSNYGMLKKYLNIDFYEGFPISYFDLINYKGEVYLEKKIKQILNDNIINAAFLGIGSDGHTASLFPNKAQFDTEVSSFKLKNETDNFDRYTLSYKYLMKSNKIIFIVAGQEKNEILSDFFKGNINFQKHPFHRIANEHPCVKFFCDSNSMEDIEI